MNSILDEIDSREEEPKPERARGPDGKFTKAETAETEEEPVIEAKAEKEPKKEPKPEATEAEPVAEAAPEQKAEPKPDTRPPSSWSAEGKTKFATLDPAIQKEVLKREEDFHRGIEQYKAKAVFADNLYRELAPYEAMIRSEGATPEMAVRNLFSAAYTLRTGTPQQKAQLLSQVAQMYGVEMPQAGEEYPAIDPTVAQLQQRIAQFEQAMQQGQQQQEVATTQTLSNEIEQFKADPQNIFFENVRQDMAALIQAGRATNLKEAYDMAIWARPDVREQILARQSREAEEKRLAEATKAAVAAKKSAPVNVRPKGVFAPAANAGKTMFDTMSSVYDDIQSR